MQNGAPGACYDLQTAEPWFPGPPFQLNEVGMAEPADAMNDSDDSYALKNAASGLSLLGLVGALLLLQPNSALSQSLSTISAQQCVFHAGEDSTPDTSGSSAPGWSSPRFDDSLWQPISQWPTQQSSEPNFWVRCRFQPAQLAPAIQGVVQISGDFSYQLFLNGSLLGTFGNLMGKRPSRSTPPTAFIARVTTAV